MECGQSAPGRVAFVRLSPHRLHHDGGQQLKQRGGMKESCQTRAADNEADQPHIEIYRVESANGSITKVNIFLLILHCQC